MSKISSEKINYKGPVVVRLPEKQDNQEDNKIKNELELQTQGIIDNACVEAQAQARKILEEAKALQEELLANARTTLDEAQSEAGSIREIARQEGEKEGFDKGYEAGRAQILQELDEKIQAVDFFASSQFEIRQKILKSAQNDAVGLCIAICRKVCHKLLDKKTVEKIIEQAFALIENKEQVNIIINPYIAEMLGDALSKKFENVKLLQNPKIAQDAIIVEALADRVDCSVSSQIDEIANAFALELGKSKIDSDECN